MTDLIDNEGVVTVFGPTNSGNAMAWKHIVNQKKIPVINNVSAGTDITKPISPGADNYMFRVSMVDREQISALMAYVKKNSAESKKVGFMSETTGYGQGGLRDMKDVAQAQGITPVDIEQFGVGDTDMTSQLNKLKAAGADTVIIWAQGTPIAQVMRSMEKINYYPRVLSSWAADNITFYDAAGKTLAEKPLFLRTVSENRTPAQDKLFARVGSQLKAPSSFSFALHGYDSVLLLAQAMKQANSTDGSAIRVALENLNSPVQGLLKTYNKPFSKTNHEALLAKDFVWVHWKDGKLLPYSDAVTTENKHDGSISSGSNQRPGRRWRVRVDSAWFQHHIHHNQDAQFLAWRVRLRRCFHRHERDAAPAWETHHLYHVRRRSPKRDSAVAGVGGSTCGDGCTGMAALCARRSAFREEAWNGLGYEHAGLRRRPRFNWPCYLGTEARRRSFAGWRLGDSNFRHRCSAAGNAASRRRRPRDDCVRPRDAKDDGWQDDARRGRKR
jgi:branched-chain amino acid transport system substrate-binding protein